MNTGAHQAGGTNKLFWFFLSERCGYSCIVVRLPEGRGWDRGSSQIYWTGLEGTRRCVRRGTRVTDAIWQTGVQAGLKAYSANSMDI